jgi:hypothetical protein
MKHEQVNNALLILAFILLIAGWACAVISFSYVLSSVIICTVLYEAKKLNKL